MAGLMATRRQRVIDTETGEIFDQVPVERRKPRTRKAETVHYGVVYLPKLAELAAEPSMTAGDFRVLIHLMARAPLGECTTTNARDLERRLGIHHNTAYRALDRLTELGFLNVDPDDRHCYWVNPQLFWRGDAIEQRRQQERLASQAASG